MECNYDGGDCCLDPVNTQYCSECQCLDGGGSTVDPPTTGPTTTGTTSPSGIMKSTTKAALEQHMSKRHKESIKVKVEKTFECNICGMFSTTKKAVEAHKYKRHTKIDMKN